MVTISGVTGAGANQWNGTFVIYGKTTNSFKYYMTSTPAASPTGTITAAKVLSYRFDDIMNSLTAKTCVHLGPTPAGKPYLTRGYANGISGGWQPKAGMKIVGSGVDATRLQLVPSQVANAHFYAVGHALTTGNPAQPNLLDFFELSDLTIDCNLVIPPGTAAACGAVRVMGNHVSIHRVKAINWGTKDVNRPCFVFSVLTGDRTIQLVEVVNAGIEDCIVVEPAVSRPTGEPAAASETRSVDQKIFRRPENRSDGSQAIGVAPGRFERRDADADPRCCFLTSSNDRAQEGGASALAGALG